MYEVGDEFVIKIAEIFETGWKKDKLYRIFGFNSLVLDENGLNQLHACSKDLIAEDGYNNGLSYGRELAKKNNWDIPKVSDVDEIEIYSDFGGGFYWQGKGSESLKVITSGYDFDEDIHDYEDGRPEWVSALWETLSETNV